MESKSLRLIMPKNTVWCHINKNLEEKYGVNNRCPQPSVSYNDSNIKCRGDYFMEEYAAKDGSVGRKAYKIITQKIENSGDFVRKSTTIEPYLCWGFPLHKSVQNLSKDGHYFIERSVGGSIINGYEMNLNYAKRPFSKGLKGKLQKAALLIANDSNGCERRILRGIGAFIFNIAKKIR